MTTITTNIMAAVDRNGDLYLNIGNRLVYGVSEEILAALGDGQEKTDKNGKQIILFGRWEADVEEAAGELSVIAVRKPTLGARASSLRDRLAKGRTAPAVPAAPAEEPAI